jgi:hypothetical protein
MALSPNTLAPEPYNLLAVALFLAYMGWVLTAVVRLFRTLHMQKAADQGRVVDIDGLGSRLQVRGPRDGTLANGCVCARVCAVCVDVRTCVSVCICVLSCPVGTAA